MPPIELVGIKPEVDELVRGLPQNYNFCSICDVFPSRTLCTGTRIVCHSWWSLP